MDGQWDDIELILCITLRTRPERRAAVVKQFAAVGLEGRVTFLEQDPDVEDGKRGCFHAHQNAARVALEQGVPCALVFEDDVEFLPHFTAHAVQRIARFVRAPPAGWSLFFLGHFPRSMELTEQPDIVRVRSMDAHAYVLSTAGARELLDLGYRGDQVDVHYHYQSASAYALYPMVAVQRASFSDTEGVERPQDWNVDKLAREAALYEGCVRRKLLQDVCSLQAAQ